MNWRFAAIAKEPKPKRKDRNMLNELVGQRVGAFLSVDMEEVLMLGYGVYNGEKPTPTDSPLGGLESPQITLDNGDVVYGYECWWEDEAACQVMVKNYEHQGVPIKVVRIADVRNGLDVRE